MNYRSDYLRLAKTDKDYIDKNREIIYLGIRELIEDSNLFEDKQEKDLSILIDKGEISPFQYISKEKIIAKYNKVTSEDNTEPKFVIESDNFFRKPTYNKFGEQTGVENDYSHPLFDIEIISRWKKKFIINERRE